MRQDIDTLDARFEELSTSLANDRQRLTDLLLTAEEEITQLREALDQAQTILQRNSADLGVQLDTLESDLQELRGQIEHTEFRLSQLEQQLMLFMEDIDMRLGN
jgi:chromosome segregation ATPase